MVSNVLYCCFRFDDFRIKIKTVQQTNSNNAKYQCTFM